MVSKLSAISDLKNRIGNKWLSGMWKFVLNVILKVIGVIFGWLERD